MQRTVDWVDGAVQAIDQTRLPHELAMLRLESVDAVIDAIARLAIRGAPGIGVAGGLGVAIAARTHTRAGSVDEPAVRADAARLASARPTAVNLRWAVDRVLAVLPNGPDAVLAEAIALITEDETASTGMTRRAADVVRSLCPGRPLRLLTHCNTGRLATVSGGTALGTVLALAADGAVAEVLATETRPLLQGARLTAWELREAEVPYRLCVDSAAPAAISTGDVDAVLVGADRVCANGDVANKIGTYGIAVAAHRSDVPFIVVAPESTVDESLPDGSSVEIEHRAAAEVLEIDGRLVAADTSPVFNPAFDITPRELITAVVTEDRVFAGSS